MALEIESSESSAAWASCPKGLKKEYLSLNEENKRQTTERK